MMNWRCLLGFHDWLGTFAPGTMIRGWDICQHCDKRKQWHSRFANDDEFNHWVSTLG